MKKIFVTLIFFICTIIYISVNAEDENNGYIVKVKEHSISLMCVTDEITYIGDNLYHADDLNTVYSFISKENIETIFPDYKFELFDLDYPYITSDTDFNAQWYLEKINAASARKRGLSGEGIKIAIIDSGINSLHPDLKQSNILQGYNCTLGAEDINDYGDTIGHGTMVAGIIAAQTDNELDISGIASNAQIIPIKITDTNSLNISSIFWGLEKALETDCDIINMSFGGAITDEEALSVLKSYIDKAEEKNIIVVAAVGNSGHTDNAMNYPAGFDSVIGVGSVDEDLTSSYFSQKNKSVFISAPGNNIISLFKNNSTTTGLGTSLSAPIVTGAAALVKQIRPECTPEEFKKILAETSSDYGLEGYDISYGHGVLNISAILESLSDCIPKFMVSQGMINQTKRIHLHNNYEKEKETNIIFSEYMNNIFDRADIIPGFKLSPGVTNVVLSRDYEKLFLWDKNLTPYTELYDIE